MARQNKTIITQSDVRSAAINGTALVLSFVFSNVISNMCVIDTSPVNAC